MTDEQAAQKKATRTKMTKAEKSWIAYDVGNSALVLLATSVIPIYFNSLASGSALTAWSFAETVASLVIALLMPILGALADMEGEAKDALQTLIDGDIKSFVAESLSAAVKGMADLLEQNREQFENVDAQIAASISG